MCDPDCVLVLRFSSPTSGLYCPPQGLHNLAAPTYPSPELVPLLAHFCPSPAEGLLLAPSPMVAPLPAPSPGPQCVAQL